MAAPQLFFIGLGNMGRGMVKNLVEKGKLDKPILLHNRTKQVAVDLGNKLGAGKTQVVDSIAEGVAQADIIFCILSSDKVVEATINTILESDVTGKLVIECSTIHPDTTERIGELVLAAGGEFVASPVFGAPNMADAGGLIGVLCGPASSVEKAKPYYTGVMARTIIDLSDQPYRKAPTLKLIGNTFMLGMIEQLAEAHVLAETSGLGTENLHKFIENMLPGPYASYSTRMLSGDYHKREYPLFAVDLARKDAGHAMALAQAAGTRLPMIEVADAHLVKVKEIRGELGDIAAIYGAVRVEAGLKFENE
ncbi:NAD binding domain of 6-phosphogluconate dehydrogenase-domain-containing protein [Podospora appendiculata]|uniref:NAD binding domain of 6-phosphogluconate dehydrogenase-domain-containing protein n=1 Tax=Podospora appendiculata TaxID=314037 RepID=A0AAE0X9K0_9PEZI|nr:NAD binding domain of 6-phosphogluconate dehydrogenase-domain-containing protein [Podospora appendiculata]